MIWLKALALWSAILVLAILNGALRERALIALFGSPVAELTSGVILCCCILLVAFLGARWYGVHSASHYWLIGAFWLALTLVFEFGFGRLVQHASWAELLRAYPFRGGNIWPVVLVATFVAPWLAAKLRGAVRTE